MTKKHERIYRCGRCDQRNCGPNETYCGKCQALIDLFKNLWRTTA